MAAHLYRRFLRLCEIWGLDSTKKGRDLGQHIRERVTQTFVHGEVTKVNNLEECVEFHESLLRLANNYYGKHYQRHDISSASGLTAEECRMIVSTDSMKQLAHIEEAGMIDRFKTYFSSPVTEQK
ncbi:ubiquinol-cytochrome-c reductase complex assembly factor 2-like [Limulus polyphemus]|uniref:Mitochondrial nucleoid factor 1 n=1 Tax=Limulus polyphemus TaxID=6850 RepID=A0ABM1SHC9_LIMPO|nr:ubiquinol-cytochrome-c reductase complex assembly factor 2-like [Limulus polyphemus]